MATVEITPENFDQTIQDHGVVLLDFWATWCGPCKTYGPIFEKASESHDDVVFGKIDIDAHPELAAAFGVQSVPSTVFFRDQLPIHMQPGLLPPDGLESLITQVKDLDMEAVKAEMAKRKAEADAAGEA